MDCGGKDAGQAKKVLAVSSDVSGDRPLVMDSWGSSGRQTPKIRQRKLPVPLLQTIILGLHITSPYVIVKLTEQRYLAPESRLIPWRPVL